MVEPFYLFDTYGLYALGVGGVVIGLLGLLAVWIGGQRPAALGAPGGAVLLAAIGALAFASGRSAGLGVAFLVLASVCALSAQLRSQRVARVVAAFAKAPAWHWGALLLFAPLVALGMAAWNWQHVLVRPGVRAVESSPARTDRNEPVRLNAALHEATPADLLPAYEAADLHAKGFEQQVVRVAPPTALYNCHGWVFAAGQYLIADSEVEAILRDNDYQAVRTPLPGDLIIYGDASNFVIHSGIVRVAEPDGLLLIESKWGMMGRFLHPAAAQPFATSWTYHRSARHGHLLLGLDEKTPATPYPPAKKKRTFAE